ncbi:hypothetical protein PR202_gb18058 [Eleusine coracana subsp. coracana]|uniref:DUF3615 domain-containing protein n=1 Tax=Eleusine coracana subsp. coracana TaxID=191504 RepID=A0AAV5F5T5_ELECO|nr:hypothetical protein PR202_gb17991 [Eleusine coracana subsp. coracana]GJN29803.1 hypothetical protein PR202_gb18058 [Eleusine coracana subsp. coracana]
MPDPGEEVGPSGTRDLWQFQIPFGEQRIENVFSNAEGGFRGNLPPVAPQDRLATRCRKSPSPVVTEDLQPQPPPSEKPVAEFAESALPEPDISSSEELLVTKSLEGLITASPPTILVNAIASSSSTSPFSHEKLEAGAADSSFALTLQEPDASSLEEVLDTTSVEELITVNPQTVPHNAQDGSPPTASSFGSKIFFRHPPGPNSRRRKETVVEEYYLVQALVNQYNDDHNLSGNFAHELENLLGYSWIYAENRWYYHFNFTTKTREAEPSSGYLFFAEMSHMQGEDAWEISCCCTINSKDNGLCYGCKNYGRPDIQHPNNTKAYFGGHLDGYLPFGDEDELSGPDYDYDDV